MATYQFKTLEDKYGHFLAPSFVITIGSAKIDSAKIPVSHLTVDADAGKSAGGCHFVIESRFNYESSNWEDSLLSVLKVGAKITILGGYVVKETIFEGFLDDYTVEYNSDSSPRISVSGIDAKGSMMNADGEQYTNDKPTATVIRSILNKYIAKGYAKNVKIGSVEDFTAQLIQEGMNDYEFINFLAKTYNMSFYIVNGEIVFDNVKSKTTPLIELRLGVSLLSFTKKVTLKQQVGKVIIYSIDPKTKKAIKGEASSTTLTGDGSQASGVASEIKDIVEKEVNFFAYTPEECQKLAQSRFDELSGSFVSGKGRCIGLPEIIPGRYISLSGLGGRNSDTYYISKVTHEYSAEEGYFTTFEVKGAKTK